MTLLTSSLTAVTASLSQRHVVLVGLGREGISSYRWLRKMLPELHLTLIDDKSLTDLSLEWQQLIDQDQQTFLTTEQAIADLQWLTNETLVVKTPGLPLHHPLLSVLQKANTQLTSNTELFYTVIRQLPQQRIKLVGITGTKGKSTTTSFIHHVLQRAGLPTVMGGNIGIPPLELLTDLESLLEKTPAKQPIWVILEQSCHQLDTLPVSPEIAVIQRIVPEHLDYYPSFERYVQAKSSIALNQQPSDVVIASSAHRTSWKVATLSPGRRLDSNREKWWNGQDILLEKKHIPASSLQLRGVHNIENLIPGIMLGQLAGATDEEIETALLSFKPLPHRLERVGTHQGVEYINDSLATMPEAAIAALEAFPDQKAILIAGGYDRQQNFVPLAEWILKHEVRGLILFPPTGARLLKTLQNLAGDHPLPPVVEIHHMAEAVHQAASWAQPGDVVLLSPASASFGEFTDYADRGDQFRHEVSLLQ